MFAECPADHAWYSDKGNAAEKRQIIAPLTDPDFNFASFASDVFHASKRNRW